MEKQGTEGGLGVRVAREEEEFFQYKITEVCTPFIISFIIITNYLSQIKTSFLGC